MEISLVVTVWPVGEAIVQWALNNGLREAMTEGPYSIQWLFKMHQLYHFCMNEIVNTLE